MKFPPFLVGDIVRYKTEFLRNTGQYTGVPAYGTIGNVLVKIGRNNGKDKPFFCSVTWCDSNQSVDINPDNIERVTSNNQ